jgi:hypothetical protein
MINRHQAKHQTYNLFLATSASHGMAGKPFTMVTLPANYVTCPYIIMQLSVSFLMMKKNVLRKYHPLTFLRGWVIILLANIL